MRVFLVRHGQTAWNIQGRAQGHTDTPLNQTGLEQAIQVGQAFDGIPIDRIYSSDLTRAVQTAEPISQVTGVPIIQRADLRERGFGQWEGMLFDEFAKIVEEKSTLQNVSKLTIRPPNGESFVDVWARTLPFVEQLFESEDDTVIVSHGGSIGVLLAQLMRGNLDSIRSFRFPNTSVTELEKRADGNFLLVRYADDSHTRLVRRQEVP